MLQFLLWRQRSSWQTIGAAVGSCVGIFLLLLALQVQRDVRYLTEGGDKSGEYVSINKQVSLLNTLGVKAVFADADLAEVRSQPFIEQVGLYTANRFKVSARIRSLGFYSDLFFESVPTNMLDVQPSAFEWAEGQREIPIIMSRDYLALYNFGFAASQGLPQLTASAIGSVNLEITLYGQGRAQVFVGRIVGFSDRVNSILVPDNFMRWANSQLAEQPDDGPSRLLMRVKNPYDADFRNFLESHGYEVSTGRLIGGKVAAMLRLLTYVLAAIGGVIMLLSVLVFLLSFQLRIAQAAPDIKLLLQIGYKQAQLSQFLIRRWLFVFGITAVVAVGLLWGVRYAAGQYFTSQGFELVSGLHLHVWLAAAILTILLAFINIVNIRRQVKKLF